MTTEELSETPPAPAAPVPADDMHQLDFLLGSFRAEYVNMAGVEETSGVAWWTTAPVLGGFAYEMWQKTPGPDITGRWTFGWNPADRTFVSHYIDSWGNVGSTTCTGWADGFLNCTGAYFAFGGKYVFNERFTVIDADHYRKECFVQEDGGTWRQVDLIDCYRITDLEA